METDKSRRMSKSLPKIFLTGGNGFLGSRTLEALLRKGYRVRCLIREGSDVSRIRHLSYETVRGDVCDLPSVLAGAKGCDAIFHLAGISSWEQIRSQAERLESVIVGGTENILETARRLPLSRTVFVSSSATINGSFLPQVFSEKSRYSVDDRLLPYSRAKRKAEKSVRMAVRRDGLDVVTVNPGELYGASDSGMVTAGNLLGFLTPFPALVCEGGATVVHVDDAANGIVLAFEKGRSGERYILGGENLTLREIAQMVRKIAGLSDRVITLPNTLIKGICGITDTFGLPSPIPKDVFQYASLYWFTDSSKAMRELGYTHRPAVEVFQGVVEWIMNAKPAKNAFSLRYGGGTFDLRDSLIRSFAALQGKKVEILKSNPKLVGLILAASDTKGTFLEQLFATPAWHPIYSIESMDGKRWEQLASDFKKVMARLEWRDRLIPLAKSNLARLRESYRKDPTFKVDAEAIARTVVRTLYELLFSHPMNAEDESLFFWASVEWRKEIALKGKANEKVKNKFWKRLTQLVANSPFREGLVSYGEDPAAWLSVFAQPFLISPQINIGDIFVTVFDYLGKDPTLLAQVKAWADAGDRARLDGVILESIRLRHPFPILERELKKNFHGEGHSFPAGTQVFMMMDQFEQDPEFNPERWLSSAAENPYHAIPFAAGPRMCIGKPIALELMAELLTAFVSDFPIERIQPSYGHLYSGRNNDGKTTLSETRYQIQVFTRGFLESFRMGNPQRVGSRFSLNPFR